jgi:hypothetical protein
MASVLKPLPVDGGAPPARFRGLFVAAFADFFAPARLAMETSKNIRLGKLTAYPNCVPEV